MSHCICECRFSLHDSDGCHGVVGSLVKVIFGFTLFGMRLELEKIEREDRCECRRSREQAERAAEYAA